MVYNIHDVMRDVRICLDQNMTSEQLLQDDDVDTLALDDIVRSKVTEGVRKVLLTAPVYMLEQGHSLPREVFWDRRGAGHIMLPEDFLRLQVFKMSDWERAVYSAISVEDAAYVRQSSRWNGIRGNRRHPVCAIGIRPEGRVLEFYSCGSEKASVAMGSYVPRPQVDAEGGVDMPEQCYRAAIYMIGSLVTATYGEADRSVLLEKLCYEELGINSR